MVYYAIRIIPGRETLVEFGSLDEMARLSGEGRRYCHVSQGCAHDWVIARREHETGLWINDDGDVQYASHES